MIGPGVGRPHDETATERVAFAGGGRRPAFADPLALAGCAAPALPCAVANDALAVTDVRRDAAGFRVTVTNRAAQPLTERVFVEVALVQAGHPIVAGSTATTASWPAGGSVTLAVPYDGRREPSPPAPTRPSPTSSA